MEDFGFWALTGGIGAIVALSLAMGFLRGGRAGLENAESDLLVYKDQLKEIDRDVARGILAEAEAEAVRLEVKRRLLAADKKAGQTRAASAGPVWVPGALLAGGVMVAAMLLYTQLGAPGYPDLPLTTRIAITEEARENRPTQAEAEAQLPAPDLSGTDPAFLTLMEDLRAALAERPDDLRGFNLLAEYEARLGRFPAAHAAQARVLDILGEAATAEDWAQYAELMVVAADGYVSPEAEDAIDAALLRDAREGRARYYKGLAQIQVGRADLSFETWASLLRDSPPNAPWVPLIEAEIADIAILAGIPESQVPQSDFGARAAEIRGMVEGLATRLAEDGGPAEDWARLVHSLAVLGDHTQAWAIVDEARMVFADDPAALTMIEAATARLGEQP